MPARVFNGILERHERARRARDNNAISRPTLPLPCVTVRLGAAAAKLPLYSHRIEWDRFHARRLAGTMPGAGSWSQADRAGILRRCVAPTRSPPSPACMSG